MPKTKSPKTPSSVGPTGSGGENAPLPSMQAVWPTKTIIPDEVEVLPPIVLKPHKVPKPSKKMARHLDWTRGAETRTVRRRGASIYTGDVPMPRLGGKLLSGEGFIEIHWHLVVDFHFENLVAAYAQPEELEIWVLGKKHIWTPDVLVVDANGVETLIELRPLEFIQPDRERFPGLAEHNELIRQAWETAAAERQDDVSSTRLKCHR